MNDLSLEVRADFIRSHEKRKAELLLRERSEELTDRMEPYDPTVGYVHAHDLDCGCRWDCTSRRYTQECDTHSDAYFEARGR